MLVLNSYFGHQFPARANERLRDDDRRLQPTAARARAGLQRAPRSLPRRTAGRRRASRSTTTAPTSIGRTSCCSISSARASAASRGTRSPRISSTARIASPSPSVRRACRCTRTSPIISARSPSGSPTGLGRRQFDASKFAPALDALYSSPRARVLDYIGLDYYDPFAAHIFRLPAFWDHEFTHQVLSQLGAHGGHQQMVGLARAAARPLLLLQILRRGLRPPRAHRGKWHGASAPPRQRRERPARQACTRSDFLRLHVHEVNRSAPRRRPRSPAISTGRSSTITSGAPSPRASGSTRSTTRKGPSGWSKITPATDRRRRTRNWCRTRRFPLDTPAPRAERDLRQIGPVWRCLRAIPDQTLCGKLLIEN